MVIQTQNSRRNCGTLNDSLCGLMCKIICSKVFGMNIEFERLRDVNSSQLCHSLSYDCRPVTTS